MNLLEESEDEFVFGVEAQGAGSHEEVSDVSSSLPGVGVEREESMEFDDVIGGEDGVFGGDILGEHGLEFFLLDFSLRHVRYF